MYLLDVTTGKVTPYAHESGTLDEDGGFASLDAFAFALARVEAVARKLVPADDLQKLFGEFGLEGGGAALRRHA